MSRRALVVGGTGQIGRAVASRLLAAGWDVTVGARTPAKTAARFVRLDRDDDAQLRAAAEGADCVVDVIAFTEAHGRQLAALEGVVGCVVAVSSAAVYADRLGRSLDTQEVAFPEFPLPITERQPTVRAGDATYAERKVAMEQALLASRVPATILRPCAVHGPGARLPRELYFVKRARDGRGVVLLAYRGESCFHPTSVANLAELARLAAEQPATRVLNCGDPDAPTTIEIARLHAAVLQVDWEEVLLPGAPVGSVGATPWSTPGPVVVGMEAAERDLGYRPVTSYREAVEETIRWLVDTRVEPTGYLTEMFDYAAEDRFLATLPAG